MRSQDRVPRNTTLTEKDGVFTLEAFALDDSSSDDEISYINCNRKLQLSQASQNDKYSQVCRQDSLEDIYKSGAINNSPELRFASREQAYIEHLTPESKKAFFNEYNEDTPERQEMCSHSTHF